MAIAFACDSCGKQFKVADTMAGRKVKCSACAAILTVPASSEEVATTPAPRSAIKETPSRPASKKTSGRPAAKDDDDSGEVDARRPKKGRAGKQKGSKTLLFAALGGAGVFLTCCMCCGVLPGGLSFFGMLPWDPMGLNYYIGGAPPPEVRFLPDNCTHIQCTNVDDLLSSGAYQQLKKEFPDAGKDDQFGHGSGISDSNIVRVLSGNTTSQGMQNPGDSVTVIKTKKAVKADELFSKQRGNQQFKQVSVKDYTIYESPIGLPSFCVVDDTNVLIGSTGSLKKVLERNGKPEFSDTMKSALRQTSFRQTMASAQDLKAAKSALPASPGGGKLEADAMATKDHVGGSSFERTQIYLCKDSSTAEDLRKVLEGELAKAKAMMTDPEWKEMIENTKVSTSGSTVTVSSSIKVQAIINMMKNKKPMGMPGLRFGI